ncbi:MAG: TonB-dependent receptor, partial [Gammaproteobacteria bacterium]|nr:TonB-dependent receptor [Gammaproteobacteria bacterium]
NFGTLSGSVKIITKEPSKDFKGEASLNLGSWNYRKAAATVSGGNNAVRYLVSMSHETGDQYEDGDGNTFSEQIIDAGAAMGDQFQPAYADMKAYEKSTFLGKIYADIADNQQLKFSYTANRSDDVLYPSSKMDALYDDSDIANLEYSMTGLGEYSKSLDIQIYSSQVDHPMSNRYRRSAIMMMDMVSDLTTEMQGLKVKNNFDLNTSTNVMYGFDTSNRNWDGIYIINGTATIKSIDDVDTRNTGLFAEMETRSDKTSVKLGLRLDNTSIDTADASLTDNDYKGLSANIFARHQASDKVTYFAGFGRSNRVPDARELYFHNRMGAHIGADTLEATRNYEFDLGFDNKYGNLNIKTKLFHSQLKDYIYYNSDSATNNFENIDATIQGLEISGAYFLSDEINIDFGLAYQKGEKDNALTGQTDTDLAEIPPLKANIAVNYDYGLKNTASVELVAVDAWDDFDADNGEQALKGYGVINAKVTHNVTKTFELTAGIDNLFDKTYATSNTYQDLTLLATGGTIMLLNEPGRYLYVNGSYQF